MSLILPHPGQPTNGSDLDASIVQENITAIAQAVQSFDASQVAAGTLTANAFAASINPNTILKETTHRFVSAGCVWSIVSGLQGTMSSGVVYVNGLRTTVNSVGAYNFTASQDTYIDIDYNGNIYYLPVGNGGTPPALTSNAVRVAKVITNGTGITSIVQSGYDTNGVLIKPNGTSGVNVSTDANGWTVYDYGKFREYEKILDASPGTSVAAGSTYVVSNVNLPVGIANVGTAGSVMAQLICSDRVFFLVFRNGIGDTFLTPQITNAYTGAVTLAHYTISIRIRK